MVAALLVALLTDSCNQGSTYDIRKCWSAKDEAASVKLHSTYVKVEARLRSLGIEPGLLAAAESAFSAARDKTCAFEYAQYLPGTIAPQLEIECDDRMTVAQAHRLAAVLAVLKSGALPTERPASPATDAELHRVYQLYLEHVTSAQRPALIGAERAWRTYRDKWCAFEGGTCLTASERDRVNELEASWLGEPFW